MTYRIRDWSQHFENNRTRELKELRFVILPNKHDGDGYTELLDHPNGAAHYGAWCALVQVASKCDPRGTLLRDGDRPHDSASLARLTRIPAGVFDEVIPRLTTIGWLESDEAKTPEQAQSIQTDSEIPQETAGSRPSRSRTPMPKSAPELNRTEEKRIEEKKEDTSRAALARGVFAFWRTHLDHPNAIFDGKRGAAIIGRLKEGYTADQLKEAIRGCKLSDFHMGREPGKPAIHDGIKLICQDAEHVDKFIAIAQSGGSNGTNGTGQPRGYQTAAERRDSTFERQYAVVDRLRRESSRGADEVLRGKPS